MQLQLRYIQHVIFYCQRVNLYLTLSSNVYLIMFTFHSYFLFNSMEKNLKIRFSYEQTLILVMIVTLALQAIYSSLSFASCFQSKGGI